MLSQKNIYRKCLSTTEGPVVAASDYMKLNSDQIRPFISKVFILLVPMVTEEATQEKI